MVQHERLQIITADAIAGLRQLETDSIQCIVVSPPYWNLRDYGIAPLIWGGQPDCPHEFVEKRVYSDSPTRAGGEGVGFNNAAVTKEQRWKTSGACSKCNAWRGCFGLEPTPELYVAPRSRDRAGGLSRPQAKMELCG